MRIKVTISMEKELLDLIDKNAKNKKLTRSSYLRSLVYKDIESKIEKEKEK